MKSPSAPPLATQPGSGWHEGTIVRQEKADGPGMVRGWLQAEPARRLVNLAGIPILILTAEASYHAVYDHCTSRYLTQAGVTHTFTRLESVGIRGNGHMMMLEKNNLQIAEVIADWLRKRVTPIEAQYKSGIR